MGATIAERYLGLATLLLGIGVVTVVVAASYLELAPSGLLMFALREGGNGWCTVPGQSIGPHCFGDYAIVDDFFWGDNDAWNGGGKLPASNYSAIAWLPALATFHLGEVLGGGQIGVLIFLALSVACLVVPAVWAGWKRWSTHAPVAVAVIGLAAGPALMALDRGNSVALAVPFLCLFAVAYVRRNFALVTVAVVGAALLRPQLAVLAVVLLVHRQYRMLLVSALSTAALTVAGFVFFPHFPANLLGWLRSLVAYNTVKSSGDGYPVNLGLGRSLVVLVDMSGLGQLMGSVRREDLVLWLDQNGMLLNLLALALGAVVLFLRARVLNPLWVVLIVLCMTLWTSSTVYAYYLAIFLVPAALLLRDPRNRADEVPTGRWAGTLDGDGPPARGRRSIDAVVAVVVALVLAPIVVPTQLVGGRLTQLWDVEDVASMYQHMIGPLLLVLYVVLLAGAVAIRPRALLSTAPTPGEHPSTDATSPGDPDADADHDVPAEGAGPRSGTMAAG